MLRWNFNTGDTYLFKTTIENPDDGRGSWRADITEEIEVLIDHGNGDYRLGSHVREVHIKWKGTEWKGSSRIPIPEDNPPFALADACGLFNSYYAIAITAWGFVRSVTFVEGRSKAMENPSLRALESSGQSIVPFDRILLPRSRIAVGETWGAPGAPMSKKWGSDHVTIDFIGRVLTADDTTCEFTCKLVSRIERLKEPNQGEASVTSKESNARIDWKVDAGVLKKCVIEEKTIVGTTIQSKSVVVELVTMSAKQMGK